jgi:F-type H+-transporting ATPase subunit delta
LKDKVSKHVLNTVLFMLDRKRGDCIADMAKQFIKLAMEEQQEAEAVVYSVTPLSEEHKQTVSTLIAKKVGKRNLRMKNEIQPDLIGGLKIRVGNQIFDGSIKGRLEKLKRKLTEVEA